MGKQNTIATEAQLREAVRALWAGDATLLWRWKECEPRQERGIDAIAELIFDKQHVSFDVRFKLNPAARDVEFLAKQKHSHPLLLIAPNISVTLARLCREQGLSCADLNGRLWLRTEGVLIERDAKQTRFRPAVAEPV